jgi:hypothetical protein
MIIDREELHVYGFNYTSLDLKSRSLGLVVREKRIVQEALRLFESDDPAPGIRAEHRRRRRQSRERPRAAGDVDQAEPQVAGDLGSEIDRNPQMLRLLTQRAKMGVDIRIIGKVAKRGW